MVVRVRGRWNGVEEGLGASEPKASSPAEEQEEAIGGEGTPEPSLGIYLQQIGRIPLLSRDVEEQLGIDMETAQGLARAGEEVEGREGAAPEALGIALDLLEQVTSRRALIDLLSQRCGLPSMCWRENLFHPRLRSLIDASPDPEAVDWVARHLELDLERAWREMIQLSIVTRLLPPPLILAEGLWDEEGQRVVRETLRSWAEHLEERWAALRRRGERAKAALAEANLRLVVSMARRYIYAGLPFLDLVQEGNLGLLRAATGFDYRRGRRFSTYASWWIRQSLARAIGTQSRTIHLPAHRLEELGRLQRARQAYLQEWGAAPTREELAAATNLDREEIERLESLPQEAISLDGALAQGDDVTLQSFLEDPSPADPVGAVFDEMLTREVCQALSGLPPRDRYVLQSRFGLGNGGGHSLEAIGRDLGITREGVRQIVRRSLDRLRRSSALQAVARELA